MTDPVYVTQLVEEYRKAAGVIGEISYQFDAHATVVVSADEGMGSIARNYAIDLGGLARRLEAASDGLMRITQKRAVLARRRR